MKKRIYESGQIERPCHKTIYCPYGPLVEGFPLHPGFEGEDLNELSSQGKLDTGYNCKIFGHDCPVYYQAEYISEYGEEE